MVPGSLHRNNPLTLLIELLHWNKIDMESIQITIELLTLFSHSVSILRFYDDFTNTRKMMMLLCKDTNSTWKQYKKAFMH